MNHPERASTKTLYKLVKQGVIEAKLLRRKGKNNPKNHRETRGKISHCKTIHDRDEQYPKASTNQEYGHFKGVIPGLRRIASMPSSVFMSFTP